QLRWKIIRFGLPLPAYEGGLRVVLVHVVGDGTEIVEEFAVDRPALVALPNLRTDQPGSFRRHGVTQREGSCSFVDDVAQPFIGRRTLIRRRCRGGEPALVDTASVGSQSVNILWS